MTNTGTTTAGRNYRIEVHTPAGRWTWGQWVSGREGYGPLTDRLERAALDTLAAEPAGSTARVYRHVPHSLTPFVEMFALTLPARQG